MTQTLNARRRTISMLIGEETIGSQDELARLLAEQGLSVTQATISRDLEAIGAVKVKRGGQLCYALAEDLGESDWAGDRLSGILAEWVIASEVAGNLVVLRARPGSAHVVGAALDSAQLPEIAGTIAGDDTLFIAVRDGFSATDLKHRLMTD